MRPLVLALLCLHLVADATGAEALAQPRGSRGSVTARLTCAEVMALVKREGDVLVAAGAAPERFVGAPGQCSASEIAELTNIVG